MRLGAYFLRRVILLIPLLIGLSLLTFTVSRVLPGDPVGLAAGPQATEEIKEALRKEFGLDKKVVLDSTSKLSAEDLIKKYSN